MEFKTNCNGLVDDTFYLYHPKFTRRLLLVRVNEYSDSIYVATSFGDVRVCYGYDKPSFDVEGAVLDACDKNY